MTEPFKRNPKAAPFIWLPEQHREAARRWREADPMATVEEHLEALRLARNHEALARLIERQLGKK